MKQVENESQTMYCKKEERFVEIRRDKTWNLQKMKFKEN